MKQFFKSIEIKKVAIFLLIISIGIFFRFIGINWDQGFHLHPDERFLTMVGIASKIPPDFFTYLNPSLSTLNPTNNNFSFFVYGIFPITLTKILALLLNFNSYNNFTLVGRFLSGYFDILTIIIIFLFTRDLELKTKIPRTTKYFASFAYSITVFAIQLSHFFTVDIFLNFFMFASVYLAFHYMITDRFRFLILSPVFFGLAVASKVTALAVLPLILFFILYPAFKKGRKIFSKLSLAEESLKIIFYIIISYLLVRLADPYMFGSTNLFLPILNQDFLKSLHQLMAYNSPEVWYPPNIQWINKMPVIFALQNIIFFGVGIPYFLLLILGFYKSLRKKQPILFAILSWVFLMFLYQSVQFVKTMRYFIYLYPFFAIFTGIALSNIYKKFPKLIFIIIPILLIWPLFFISIYIKPHSRVTASQWIYQNLPNNSVILSEYWDDGLPLPIPGENKTFTTKEFPVFDIDTSQKWQTMDTMLQQGDYLILSSNRGWGSIPTVPNKYPQTSKFYADLFAGKLHYQKIAEFTSYPSLRYLGIPIDFPDGWAEEAFTVYDHPIVMIFKNMNHK
ncbi:MAG TPA: glycosyltransferase family 39 protein [Patescibacteria group bacterium]